MASTKTSISIDADLLHLVEETANEYGVSRSEIFGRALRTFFEARANARTLEKLNRVYAREAPLAVEAEFRRAAARKLLTPNKRNR